MIGSAYLRRAQLLMAQDRYQEAEKEIGQALGDDPNDPFALAMLSACYLETDRRSKALELALEARGKVPDFPFFYHQLARAYFYNNELTKCRETIAQGIRLAPQDADFQLLSAQVEYFLENWEGSLAAADKGLALNPESVSLINQHTQALVKLNRKAEAASTIDFALHREPENAYAHANKGWVAIEQDQYDTAIQHFKTSLRLDPTSAYARTGLKEAIKGKNILYRYVLKYFLWMGKMQGRNRWLFVIGIYILYQFVLRMGNVFPILAMVLSPLLALYILMAFSSWIAMPVSNAFLRFHPLGKHALIDDELHASTAVTGLLCSGIASILLFFLLGHQIHFENGDIYITEGGDPLFGLSLVLLFLSIAAGAYFKTTAGSTYRKRLGGIFALLAAIGLIGVFSNAGWLFALFFLGVLGMSLYANVVLEKEAREV